MHVEACECGQACFHYCLSAGYSRDSIWITLETPQLWLAHDRPGKAPKLYRGLYSDPVVGLVYSLPWVRNGSLRLWQMIFTSYSGQRRNCYVPGINYILKSSELLHVHIQTRTLTRRQKETHSHNKQTADVGQNWTTPLQCTWKQTIAR